MSIRSHVLIGFTVLPDLSLFLHGWLEPETSSWQPYSPDIQHGCSRHLQESSIQIGPVDGIIIFCWYFVCLSHSPRLSPAQYSLTSAESWPKTPIIHCLSVCLSVCRICGWVVQEIHCEVYDSNLDVPNIIIHICILKIFLSVVQW